METPLSFNEFLRQKEKSLILAIGEDRFNDQKMYFVHEIESLVEEYLKLTPLKQ